LKTTIQKSWTKCVSSSQFYIFVINDCLQNRLMMSFSIYTNRLF